MTPPYVVDVFAALADPTRRALLTKLQHDGECDVGALVAAHDVSQPAISRHLRILLDAGLVAVRQHGRRRHYRVQADGLLPLISYLTAFWDQRLAALDSVLDELEERT
ncbi:MAG: ArsR/SmtB family transcription factor [Nitriliruptoraceae bacterium]